MTGRPPGWLARTVLLGPALLVTAFFFLGSTLILFLFSLQPFVAGQIGSGVTLASYAHFAGDPYYWGVVATTLKLGAVTTVACALVGYPVAYAMDRLRRPALRNIAYFIVFTPLMTSVIVRSYGWSLILGDRGVVNVTLAGLGIVARPVAILYEFTGVTIALVHILLPFMVFPVLGVLGQVDRALREAAADLGADRWQIFRRVTLPLTLQGLVVGCELTFALSISAFATPSLLGGGRVQVLASLIYSDVGGLNWPLASVESFVLLATALLSIAAFNWVLRRPLLRRATAG